MRIPCLWLSVVVLLITACSQRAGNGSASVGTGSASAGTGSVSASTIGSSSASQTPTEAEPSTPIRPGVLASLRRTACYGWCPSYELTIYEDGRVEYDGRDYVKTKGKVTSKVDAAKLEAVREAFRSAQFFSLGNYKYDSTKDPTDGPSAVLYYAEAGRAKIVDHYGGSGRAPATVATLEDAIDSLLGVEQWVGTDSEREALNRHAR